MNNKASIALLGAGGKMGIRILDNLAKTNCGLFTCEVSEDGIKKVKDRGFKISDIDDAVPKSDLAIMAVPDAKIGDISKTIVPMMKEDSTLILLDPAAAYAKKVFLRDDCSFVVTHPCHPPLFYHQKTEEARDDQFGGVAAEQNIVIALLQGSEDNFKKAEEICKEMFSPVMKAYRVTVEQMALLEPAAVEVLAASCLSVIREGLDELVKRGIAEETARAFILGHLNIELAILFKDSNPFSDACIKAIEYGRKKLFKENWKEVFEKESIKEVLGKMLSE